jgi:hypothetical protein
MTACLQSNAQGLLSTSALLDRFEVDCAERVAPESALVGRRARPSSRPCALEPWRAQAFGQATVVCAAAVVPSTNANAAANLNPPRGQRVGSPIPFGR